MTQFTNISTYKFTRLEGLKEVREKLIAQCKEWGLKGTILLSTEGINLFVAGQSVEINLLLSELRSIPGLEDLNPKFSESSHQPFTRMLVRIKKEIIAFGVEGIDPGRRTSPKLSPKELKKWLDEGNPVTLLDTRNDYEINLGTFKGALPIGIKHFRDFPKAVEKLPSELKERPVVMFCTGGIRCEKAGPYMESQGFRNVFQLDGGILKYFEECGNSHYDGNCFVFDQRVGVDPTLQETPNVLCYACLTPLSTEEQSDSRYKLGESCPYCFVSSEEKMRAILSKRHQTIEEVMKKLPGSEPYIQRRPVKVPAKYDGLTLIDFLAKVLKHIPLDELKNEIKEERVLDLDYKIAKEQRVVRAGERYYHLAPLASEPDVNTDLKIRYEDEALIILEKPAPLPVHAGGRFNRNTLQYILEKTYFPQRPLPAHRLDANTTGVMLVARTKHFAGLLQPQFSSDEVEKRYLAKVYGHPPEDFFTCELPLSEETNQVGARFADSGGLPSKTEFKVLERFIDGTSLLEVTPITGRTNQIRIHLWELGYPICGEQLYLPGKKLGRVQTGTVEDPPLCLHARSITFTHPLTKKRVFFEAEVPSYFM